MTAAKSPSLRARTKDRKPEENPPPKKTEKEEKKRFWWNERKKTEPEEDNNFKSAFFTAFSAWPRTCSASRRFG